MAGGMHAIRGHSRQGGLKVVLTEGCADTLWQAGGDKSAGDQDRYSRLFMGILGLSSRQALPAKRTDVYRQPVNADLLDNLVELLEFDRFAYIAVGSQVVTFDPVSLFVRGG